MLPGPSPATRALRILRSVRGAFDLPSIIAGVVVVGILAAGVLAAVFGVIPFAQENGAKQDLNAIRTAQGVAKAKDGRFMNSAELTAAGYISSTLLSASVGGDSQFERVADVSSPKSLAVEIDAGGTCYVSVAKAPTGKLFVSTSLRPEVFSVGGEADVSECLDAPAMTALFAALPGGTTVGASGAPSDVAVTSLTSTSADFTWTAVGGATGYKVETRPQGGTWTTLSANQPGTTARITGSSGNTVEVRIATISDTGTSAPSAAVTATFPAEGVGTGGTSGAPAGTRLVVFGDATSGRVPLPELNAAFDPSPIGPAGSITAVAATQESACAIVNEEVYCWGGGRKGQLGNGTQINSATPQKVLGLSGLAVTQISATSDSFCAIADGNIYCWGSNYRGQMGRGTGGNGMDGGYQSTAMPAVMPGPAPATTISGGHTHFCTLLKAVAYCWGGGYSGQTTQYNNDTPTPTAVKGLTGPVTSISARADTTCARTDQDYCWGSQMGRNYSNTYTPYLNASFGPSGETSLTSNCPISGGKLYCGGKEVAGLPSPVTSYVTNTYDYHQCAVANGRGYCKGNNNHAQLGLGAKNGDKTSFVEMGTFGALAGKTVTSVAAGDGFTVVAYR